MSLSQLTRTLRAAAVVSALCVLGWSTISAQDAQTPAAICEAAVPAEEPTTREFTQAEQVTEPGVDYRAILCTEAGAVYVDLLEDAAPVTVNNFVFLAQQNFYNNTTFHRVIADFMAQGGDPTGTGTGGPGYQFQDEFAGYLTFDTRGWLAMANAGPGTNGSQFFITTVPTPHLNFAHTIFGQVLEGQSNVEAIELRDPETATEPGTTLNTVVIITDPASVETSYTVPEEADQQYFEELITLVNSDLPESLLVDNETSGVFTQEQVVQSAPEALQDEFAAFLDTNNFQFRAAHRITNGACDLQSIPYMAISYTLDQYATAADAQAALDAGLYNRIAQEQGYEEIVVDRLEQPVYQTTRTVCDQPAVDARTFMQRGNYVATVSAVYPASHEASVDVWLADFVGTRTYEVVFADALRRAIR